MIYSIDSLDQYSRILVTGGAGFIGGALIRRLLKETNALVFNLDKLGYASDFTGVQKLLAELGKESFDRYELLNVDLVDKESTFAAVKSADPDIIF